MTDLSKNQRTLASYEAIALEYAASTKGTPSGVCEFAMRQLAQSLPEGGTVLELGSGPGWDADFLESLGARVRRTDASTAFCRFQTSRGKSAERLDAITDDYSTDALSAYEAIMALYVLQHIEREATDVVLGKVAAALRVGGSFLVSVRVGVGDLWEGSPSGNRYHVTLWEPAAFEERLGSVGLEPFWTARTQDDEGPWLTVLARKVRADGSNQARQADRTA